MANTAFNTIVIRSNNPDNQVQRVREAKAGAAITPGMLCQLNPAGEIVPHSTVSGIARGRLVALENFWSDHGGGKNIDHPYAVGETVRYIPAQSGDQLYMFVEPSSNIVLGDVLESSDTAGYLQEATVAATTLADAIIGYAAQAVTTSGSAGRCLVDIA